MPSLLLLLPPRLCRLWPYSPPTRLLSAATEQRSSPSNYYELLGVHPDASAEEVKRAFFTKSKELHPDRDPGNPALHSRFVELNEAYRVLSREESRRKYDHQLHSASPPESSGTRAQPKYTQETHRKLEQVHRSFMDEKDRIITAIYNDTRARARSVVLDLASVPVPELSGSLSRSIFSPGPTEPGFSRSGSRDRSLRKDPPRLQKALGSYPRIAALEGVT
ncbi:dnaJ homolog subfamily C member 4 isoform X4 [Cricetulus griseus]|uniref:DnaJ homolog subfamily C member 4 n=1 Tax=Cricetulus griseus TaxID=10029 RepID=A0A9J7FNB7_CRIGR|nr:dnaJ homolog subfamily C member 4 isoform X4 [Cricetulus griseus]XP_027264230.1 dnaJ homolog subfamily C member 4 isoform X4 [Cricetulus griseus]